MDYCALARQYHPVAIFEIGHAVGEGRKCDRIGAEEHLPVAMTDGERRAHAGAEHEIVLAFEDDRQSEGTFEALEHIRHRFARRCAARPLPGDELSNHFGVGVGRKLDILLEELVLQPLKILGYPVVNDNHIAGDMRMGVDLVGGAVGRPAGVAETGRAGKMIAIHLRLQIGQLAWRPDALDSAILENGDPRRIVTAIFKPLERLEKLSRDRFLAQNADNPAHDHSPFARFRFIAR